MKLSRDLRKQWEQRGLPGNCASSGAVPPPAKGFHRLYHLVSAEHAITNIVFGRIKVGRFVEMNDPFELLALSSKQKYVRRLLEAYKEKINEQMGLLCFSADWLNPVLWSHYAENHRGMCLGFDVAEGRVERVSYEDDKLKEQIEETAQDINSKLAKRLVLTKFKSWSYEDEWRAVVDLKDTHEEGKTRFVKLDS